MQYAINKGVDQPAHPRSLISTFIVRCLNSIIHLISISEISSLYLASVAAQAGLCLTWSQIPKTGFLVTRLILFTGDEVRPPHEANDPWAAIAHLSEQLYKVNSAVLVFPFPWLPFLSNGNKNSVEANVMPISAQFHF